MNHTEMVREFSDAFLVETPTKPAIPDENIRNLRRALIGEERDELYDSTTPTEALDAIADLLYVVEGAALAYGFTPYQVDAAFREVHRSNMSKLWTGRELDSRPEGTTWKPSGITDRYVVTNAIGKIVKSPSYSPANLKDIAEGLR